MGMTAPRSASWPGGEFQDNEDASVAPGLSPRLPQVEGEQSTDQHSTVTIRAARLPVPIASRAVNAPRDPEAERALRRSLVSGLPKTRRYHDPNQIDICLPPGFLAESAPGQVLTSQIAVAPDLDVPTEGITAMVITPGRPDQVIMPNPVSKLGAGRVDPFARYPIATTAIDQYILDQLFTSPDPALRTFRENWFPIAVNDPAIFHQLLASAAWRIRKIRGENPDNSVSIAHHSLAIQTVNSRLSDPVHLESDYAIASVAILICYSVVNDDFTSFSTHMDGLAKLIELRGGLDIIGQNPTLRRIIFSVDLSGGSRQDLPPRFPLPEALIRSMRGGGCELATSTVEVNASLPWHTMFPPNHPMSIMFGEVSAAVDHAKRKASHHEVWIRVDFPSFWLDPIAWKLLGMKVAWGSDNNLDVLQEAARLGILLFFGEIRRKCGALAVSTLIQMKKLRQFMISVGANSDWTRAQPLLLWIMFFGFFESWQQPEYEWYLGALARVAHGMGLSSWSTVVATVRSFLWIPPIHDERVGKFRDGFESKLTSLDNSPASVIESDKRCMNMK